MESVKKRSCIIYGGAGFIGSHIAERFLKNDFRVTIFDKINASRRNITHILDKVNFIEGDFHNRVDLKSSMKDHNYAIHLVSSTLPADSNLNPVYDVESNLVSSLNFFEECVRQKIKKVIFISSGGTVYGNPLKVPINEDHPTNPTSSYGITKLTIEKYLELYRNLKGLEYTVLRFSNPFGERQNPKTGQGLIAALLYRVKNEQPIEVWGDGNVVRDYFYIKDGAEAVYKSIMQNGKFRTYNISSGTGISINALLAEFRKILKLKFKVVYKDARKFDVQVNILDNRRALKYLKWKPETKFGDALKITWGYILDNE
jgi:UDP-glucose 4-epimerase